MEQENLLFIVGLLISFGVGLGFGSYATMPPHRLPKGEPCAGRWVGPKSRCPQCKTQLRTIDLVPVFNWLVTHGTCQHCGWRIPYNYLFIEAGVTTLSVVSYLVYGLSQEYMLVFGMGICLIMLTVSDWLYKTLPDPILVVIIMLGLVYRTLQDGDIHGFVQGFVFAALLAFAFKDIYQKFAKAPYPNIDYLKFFAIVGIWLSFGQFWLYLMLLGAMAAIFWLLGFINADFRANRRYGPCLFLPLYGLCLFPEMDIYSLLSSLLS